MYYNYQLSLVERIVKVWIFLYSRVRNKHSPTFINFWNFFQGLWSYYGLKRLKFYYISLHILRGYVYSFCQIFQRLRLFKGLRLFRTLEQSWFDLINSRQFVRNISQTNLFLWRRELAAKNSILFRFYIISAILERQTINWTSFLSAPMIMPEMGNLDNGETMKIITGFPFSKKYPNRIDWDDDLVSSRPPK